MGNLLKIPGLVTIFGGIIWGITLNIRLFQDWIGDWIGGVLGTILSVLLSAALYWIAPVIAVFANSDWTPLLVILGSPVIGGAMVVFGTMIDGEKV